METKIIKTVLLSRITKVGGIQEPNKAKDAGGGFAYGNKRRRFGGTDNSQAGNDSIFNDDYLSVNKGPWTHSIAPWARRNEMVCAQSETKFATPRGMFWGGNAYLPGENPSGGVFAGTKFYADSWYCDDSGYNQITATMTGFENMGFAYDGFLSSDGNFYTFAGDAVGIPAIDGTGKIIRSADLVAWEDHALMPFSCRGFGRFSVKEWKGVWFLVGGNNQLFEFWVSRNKGMSWELVESGNPIFSSLWPKLVSCNWGLILVCGSVAGNSIGEPGVYLLDDLDDLQFKRLQYEREATHASTGFASADGEVVYLCDGNMDTPDWEIRNIVNDL